MLGAAGLYATAELLGGLIIGQFLLRDRAEATLFLGFRPWLLLLLVLAVQRQRWAWRISLYALALVAAGAAEAVLVHGLGAQAPWPEAVRAAAGGWLLAAVLDLCVWLGRRITRPLAEFWRTGLAAVIGLSLLALPGPVRTFERFAVPPTTMAAVKPEVALLTGLPLVWGEGGIDAMFNGTATPAEAYTLLTRHYRMKLIDALPPASLSRRELLLIAQPRPLTAAELVEIDAWVRHGGQALMLVDPALRWPSDYPAGDRRRPPKVLALAPLLKHWGLDLTPGPAVRHPVGLRASGRLHRVVMASPGRFASPEGPCLVRESGLVADCGVGRGRAILIADADLLRDALWVAPGPFGASREGRLADNGLYIANSLAELAGMPDLHASDTVRWADPMRSRRSALLAASLIPVACFGIGTALRLASRRRRR